MNPELVVCALCHIYALNAKSSILLRNMRRTNSAPAAVLFLRKTKDHTNVIT